MCRGLNTNTIIKNKNVKISVLRDFFPPMNIRHEYISIFSRSMTIKKTLYAHSVTIIRINICYKYHDRDFVFFPPVRDIDS